MKRDFLYFCFFGMKMTFCFWTCNLALFYISKLNVEGSSVHVSAIGNDLLLFMQFSLLKNGYTYFAAMGCCFSFYG